HGTTSTSSFPYTTLFRPNHNKNYFIGLGGKRLLGASHMASAVYGIENNLGNLLTPVRACFNYAEEHFLGHLPDVYLQVVMDYDRSEEHTSELQSRENLVC